MIQAFALLLLTSSVLAGPVDRLWNKRQGSFYDFGADETYCACPPVTGQPLVEVNAYLPNARDYFLDCQYSANGEPCEYAATTGDAVNPPSYCPAKAESLQTTDYCYVTCPSSLNNSPLDTTQSNVVIVASGTSYTTCRYQNGANCQYNPATGALGNTAAGGDCPANNIATQGCCFTLDPPASSTTTPSSSSGGGSGSSSGGGSGSTNGLTGLIGGLTGALPPI